ncbi:uncharacterized protein LOC131187392 isoform X1 [Ahaetulla prasina]|uniref:uncharacterized protein LOC131187392 isoform X1 n=1 Tax=Ahaetulla prasina TaxID=499056 RepID=UPI0026482090|nr:uncharacterized protein LOC131187392 isoform X1 [Ahaetulla prasina]
MNGRGQPRRSAIRGGAAGGGEAGPGGATDVPGGPEVGRVGERESFCPFSQARWLRWRLRGLRGRVRDGLSGERRRGGGRRLSGSGKCRVRLLKRGRGRNVSRRRRRRALAGAQNGRRAGMGQQVGRVGEPGAAALQHQPPPPPQQQQQQQQQQQPLSQPQSQPRGLRGSNSSGSRPASRRRETAAPRAADSGFNIFTQHDPSHPGHKLFQLLPSKRRYRELHTRTTRHKYSVFRMPSLC